MNGHHINPGAQEVTVSDKLLPLFSVKPSKEGTLVLRLSDKRLLATCD